MMKKVLILAALAEGMTGLALLLVPSFVGWLLFGEELTGAGIAGRARHWHRPDRIGRRVLAGAAGGRHVDL